MISDILATCKQYSMIGNDRMLFNMKSVDTIEADNIEGDIVEIGVWKGGSMLSMIMKYETYKKYDRTFYLYDTFTGMTLPSTIDRDLQDKSASDILFQEHIRCFAPYEMVKSNIDRHTRYPHIQYIVGDICQNTTFPKNEIALLRLDTDWYESTKVELETFYPRVKKNGIVIVDDYGHWKGCKQAVDEFLVKHPEISIQKIDYTGIWFRKP